jgi:hypothetical protein
LEEASDVNPGSVERDALHAALRDIAVDEGYGVERAAQLADLALRRWRSFDRRGKPNKRTLEYRIADLRQGLRQWYGDDLIYAAPGEVERLAQRFGEVLY